MPYVLLGYQGLLVTAQYRLATSQPSQQAIRHFGDVQTQQQAQGMPPCMPQTYPANSALLVCPSL